MTHILRAASLGLLLAGAAIAGEGSTTPSDGHAMAPMPAPQAGAAQMTPPGNYTFNGGLQGQS